jgi:hypothetical protein
MNPGTLLISILLSITPAAGHARESADVIVYGSTPGGFCAAIAAALAAKDDTPVQKVPYPKLRERLLAQGQVLELPKQGIPDPKPAARGKGSRD